MAKTNSEVAAAFVAGGKPCRGSNTSYSVLLPRQGQGNDPVAVREFTSYSTVVAVIRDDILWWNDYRSTTTQMHLSCVRSAWDRVSGDKPMVCVPFPGEGASTRNVEDAVTRSMNAVNEMLTPRIHLKTQVKHWAEFLRRLAATEHLLTLPCYGTQPTEAVLERLAIARVIRDGNTANPTGLDTVITNVRAVYALEGYKS